LKNGSWAYYPSWKSAIGKACAKPTALPLPPVGATKPLGKMLVPLFIHVLSSRVWLPGGVAGRMAPMTERTWQSPFRPRGMVLTLLATVCVLGLTHIPQSSVPRVFQVNGLDKLQHVVAYGLIAGLFLRSLRTPAHPAVLVIGFVVLAAIGALDELTQPWVNRTASVLDYLSDLAGVAIAYLVFSMRAISARKAAWQRGQSD